jgi:hypothetical protein
MAHAEITAVLRRAAAHLERPNGDRLRNIYSALEHAQPEIPGRRWWLLMEKFGGSEEAMSFADDGERALFLGFAAAAAETGDL